MTNSERMALAIILVNSVVTAVRVGGSEGTFDIIMDFGSVLIAMVLSGYLFFTAWARWVGGNEKEPK